MQLTYLGYSSLIEDTVKNCSFESLFPSMLELAFLLLELVETVERELSRQRLELETMLEKMGHEEGNANL